MPRFDRTAFALLLLIGGVLGAIAYGRGSTNAAVQQQQRERGPVESGHR